MTRPRSRQKPDPQKCMRALAEAHANMQLAARAMAFSDPAWIRASHLVREIADLSDLVSGQPDSLGAPLHKTFGNQDG